MNRYLTYHIAFQSRISGTKGLIFDFIYIAINSFEGKTLVLVDRKQHAFIKSLYDKL